MSKLFNQVNDLAGSALNKVKSSVDSKIFNTVSTKVSDFSGNLLKTDGSDLTSYLVSNDMPNDEVVRQRLYNYKDWRAILRVAPISSSRYASRTTAMLGKTKDASSVVSDITGNITDYNTGFLRVLTEIGGILFPYTPIINVSGKANWQKQSIVHSNINYYSWENSEPESYDISGDFTASNPSEALYCLAILNFLRTITKGSGPNASGNFNEILGAAPPILYLSAYGSGMIDEVPVVVDSYSYSLAKDVDYVEIILDPKNNWQPILDKADRFNNQQLADYVISRVPTKFNLSLKLITNINPAKYRRFSLWDYKNGAYIRPNSTKYGINTGWTW